MKKDKTWSTKHYTENIKQVLSSMCLVSLVLILSDTKLFRVPYSSVFDVVLHLCSSDALFISHPLVYF